MCQFRIENSNWISCIFWFGPAFGGIQKNAQHIFLKEAKAAAFQLRSPAGWGGEINVFKRRNGFQMMFKFFDDLIYAIQRF